MTLEEFVRLEPKQVRRDKELMQLFVNYYEAAFSFIPKCVGCSFNGSFKKLARYANSQQKNIKFDVNSYKMEAKTFELKKEYKLKILSYKKNGVTHRKYGHAITEDFARELVSVGKSDLFKVLPKIGVNTEIKSSYKKLVDLPKSKENDSKPLAEFFNDIKVKKYSKMDYRTELIPMYNEVSEKTGKEAKSRSKENIIAFLIENEG